MTYALRFLPDVEGDAIAGYAWYAAKSPGLGEEFLRVFYACASEIPRNPLLQATPEFTRDFWVAQKVPVCYLLHHKKGPGSCNRALSLRT